MVPQASSEQECYQSHDVMLPGLNLMIYSPIRDYLGAFQLKNPEHVREDSRFSGVTETMRVDQRNALEVIRARPVHVLPV